MSLYTKIFPPCQLKEIQIQIEKMLQEQEDKKIIKILKKDEFDLKNGSLVENGFMTPLEYYRLKELHRQGYFS